VFRKTSLDRLASPEQLDQLLRVTDTKGWAALGGIGVLLAAATLWGGFGRVSDTVAGTGILVKSGGISEVVPLVGGRVSAVSVSVGDTVAEGAVVARVAQEDLAERVQQARTRLAHLRTQHEQATAFGRRDAAAQVAYLAQQRASLAQSIEARRRSMRWLAEKARNQERLATRGLVTRSTLLATRRELDAAREQAASAGSQITELRARQLQLESDRVQEEQAGIARVREQEETVGDLERQLRTGTEVLAPQSGRILEVMAERGSVVAPGEPVLTLDLTGRGGAGGGGARTARSADAQRLEAVLYVPSVHGKRVKVGMRIRIAPSTVKQEEYGLMVGRVTYVSDFPATSRGMRRVLKNEQLVQTLSNGDAPYEVHAELVPDASTPSRYRWTSSDGPPVRVQSGTLAVGNVEVSARRPLEMVIPIFRKYTGI
jgi:HlyD family secretion protein